MNSIHDMGGMQGAADLDAKSPSDPPCHPRSHPTGRLLETSGNLRLILEKRQNVPGRSRGEVENCAFDPCPGVLLDHFRFGRCPKDADGNGATPGFACQTL